jgi:type I restriction enzyme S subunit
VQLGRQRSPGKRSNKYATKYVRAANITWNGLKLDDVLDMEFTPAERETFALHDGDVLLSEASGSADEVGKPAIWRGEIDLCCFQNTVIRFRPEATESRFAYYLFHHFAESGVFVKASLGVGIHHLGAQRFSALPMPLPPLREQGRIADRLDELFTDLAAGVSALERVQLKLNRYRSAVLLAAVTSRLTEKWRAQHGPGKETGGQLLQRILIERRRQWEACTLAKYEHDGRKPPKNWRDRYVEPATAKTDDLPELPTDWSWATQDQVGEVQLGRQRSPQHHSGKHMRPYLRVANVYEDRISKDDVLKMNFTPKEFVTYELRYGDILLNEGQSMELVGRPAMYRDEVPGSCFQNTLVRQRVFEGVSPDYALIVALAQFRTGRYRQIARITTSIAHLGAERFAAVEFPLPPFAEQCKIAETVQQKLSQIDAMEAEVERGLARGSRLRQATLKAAFAGKLVPQDPKDEPATALLERIKLERLQASAERNGRPKKFAMKDSKRKASRSDEPRKLSASRIMKRKSR